MNTLARSSSDTTLTGIRVGGTALVLVLALLGWHVLMLTVAVLMLLLFKAYEVVLGGVVLDATFAPAVGPGSADMLFTAILLSVAVAIYYVHRVLWR